MDYYLNIKIKLSNLGGKLRPGIVHRIDKDTSGVIVVAKDNDIVTANLSEQFSKTYYQKKIRSLNLGCL